MSGGKSRLRAKMSDSVDVYLIGDSCDFIFKLKERTDDYQNNESLKLQTYNWYCNY